MVGGGWLGSRFTRSQAGLHRDVALAELHLRQQTPAARTNLTVPDRLALDRAARMTDTLLPAAVEKRQAFGWAGWAFGGWVGLVLGLKLAGFSFWRRRTDYEPDRGGCFGCARCFLSCPQERVRLGLLAPEDAPQGPPEPAQRGSLPAP
jgi:ferredoxin